MNTMGGGGGLLRVKPLKSSTLELIPQRGSELPFIECDQAKKGHLSVMNPFCYIPTENRSLDLMAY